jgi:hypothetical protein
MKIFLVLAVAASVLMLAPPRESLAQGVTTEVYGGRYNPRTVWTVSGEVISVDKVDYGRRGYHGVHLILKTAKGILEVHLGPSWFVERQALKVSPHDLIEVTGSPVIYEHKPALLAAEVKKGAESMHLREADGLPLWRASGLR